MKRFLRQQNIYQLSTLKGKQSVGFVGLGNMGSGMVKNLSKQYDVTAFDVIPETRTKLRKEGLNIVDDISEISKNKNIQNIILMLPAAQHVKSLCLGDNGFFKNWSGNIIDCSTIGVTSALELVELSKGSKVKFIDAPVSGGVVAAANGILTFMVGSENQTQFDSIKSILQPMAKNVFNCKKLGGGQIVKTANNMALAIQMMSISESLNLGVQLGIEPEVLSQIMGTATSQCWSLTSYNPHPGIIEGVPSSRQYNGGFACQLMAKDLGLSMEAAQSAGVSVPLGEHATKIYKKLASNENATKDFSVVYDLLKNNKL